MSRNYLKILICQDEKFKNCCHNDLKNERKHFKAGQEDTFDLGHSNGDCQKFKVIKKCFIEKKNPFNFRCSSTSDEIKASKPTYLLIFSPELCFSCAYLSKSFNLLLHFHISNYL